MATIKQQRKLKALFQGGGVGIRMAGGAGANINTNITITGIKVGDTILAAMHLTSGVWTTDLFAECNITADDTVQNTTTDTTGDEVIVLWATPLSS